MIFGPKTRSEARKRFKKNRLRVICVPLRARKRVRFPDPCLSQPAILQETSSLTDKKERKSFSEMINKNHFSGKNPFRGRDETRKRSKSGHLKPAASPQTGSRIWQPEKKRRAPGAHRLMQGGNPSSADKKCRSM